VVQKRAKLSFDFIRREMFQQDLARDCGAAGVDGINFDELYWLMEMSLAGIPTPKGCADTTMKRATRASALTANSASGAPRTESRRR